MLNYKGIHGWWATGDEYEGECMGPYKTYEDALETGLNEELWDHNHTDKNYFFVIKGGIHPLALSEFFSFEKYIQNTSEHLEDEYGADFIEQSDFDKVYNKKNAFKDLDKIIEKAMDDWQNKHDLKMTWTEVNQVETYLITVELTDAGPKAVKSEKRKR